MLCCVIWQGSSKREESGKMAMKVWDQDLSITAKSNSYLANCCTVFFWIVYVFLWSYGWEASSFVFRQGIFSPLAGSSLTVLHSKTLSSSSLPNPLRSRNWVQPSQRGSPYSSLRLHFLSSQLERNKIHSFLSLLMTEYFGCFWQDENLLLPFVARQWQWPSYGTLLRVSKVGRYEQCSSQEDGEATRTRSKQSSSCSFRQLRYF